MKPTPVILALVLATATSGVFAAQTATDDDSGSMTAAAANNALDIFGRPIVNVDAVRELYREEPWVNPLPEFWGFEHRSDDSSPD